MWMCLLSMLQCHGYATIYTLRQDYTVDVSKNTLSPLCGQTFYHFGGGGFLTHSKGFLSAKHDTPIWALFEEREIKEYISYIYLPKK